MKKLKLAIVTFGAISLSFSNINAQYTQKIERISGNSRYKTAVEVSNKFFKQSDTVVVADGKDFPDAISSSVLAKYYNCPIILIGDEDNVFLSEIKRLSAKNIIIIGGEKSVSVSVENRLKKLGKVLRISGSNRYETSLKVADKLKSLGSKYKNLYLSNGNKYTDALSISTLANLDNSPIILTKKDSIPYMNSDFTNPNIKKHIIGGKESISFDEVNGEKCHRIFGKNRYETASKIADIAFKKPTSVILASGENFADSLVSTSVSNIKNIPILLNNNKTLLSNNRSYILKHNIKNIFIVGGENSISNSLFENEFPNTDKLNVENRHSSSSSTVKITSQANKNEREKTESFKIDGLYITSVLNKTYDYYILSVKELKYIPDSELIEKLSKYLNVNKEKIYTIDGKSDLEKTIVIMDKPSENYNFEKGNPIIEDGLYYSTDNNKLVKDSTEYNSKIKFISGNVSSDKVLNIDESLIGNPSENSLNAGIGIQPQTKLVQGINFNIQNTKPEALDYNSVISSTGSTKNLGDGIKISNNNFNFGEVSDSAVNAISIYGNKSGTIEITGNKTKGLNKGEKIGRPSVSTGIIRIVTKPFAGANVVIKDNTIDKSEYHGIIVMSDNDVNMNISSNTLNNIGQNAIIVSNFGDGPTTIKGNKIKSYGVRKIITGGNAIKKEKSEVNDFEVGITVDYINPVYGVKLNDVWFNNDDKLKENIIKNNDIASVEENNKIDGVLNSTDVSVLRKYTFLDPSSEINKRHNLSKNKVTILKDENGDNIYGQNMKNPDREVTVGSLQILGKGSGNITLPQNLNVIGDLVIDCPNADLKNLAKVNGKVIIKNIKSEDKSSFDATESISTYKMYAEKKDSIIDISNIVNKKGEKVDKSKSNIKNIEISYNKDNRLNVLDKKMYSVDDEKDQIKINPKFLNTLEDNTVFILKYTDPDNNITEVKKNVKVELEDKTSGTIDLRKDNKLEYTYKHAQEPIVLDVKNIHDMAGNPLDKSQTTLKGNVTVEGVLLKSDKDDFEVDDVNDTITIKPKFLNKIKSTNYPNSKAVGLGLSGEIKIVYSDPNNKVGEIKKTFKVKVNNYSTVNIELISPLTFMEGNAPEDGISFKFSDARDCTGKLIDVRDIDYSNIGIEAFPFDWKYEVSKTDNISFDSNLYTIDKEKGILTFKKSYLDKLNVSKAVNTEHGTKVYTFILNDEKNGLEFRSDKFTIHIKKQQVNLDSNTTIKSKDDSYIVDGETILSGKKEITTNTKVRELIDNFIGENPRVLIRVYPSDAFEEGKLKDRNKFKKLNSSIKEGDKVSVIAEDGETIKSYTLNVKKEEVLPNEEEESKPIYRALMVANYDYPGEKFDLKGPKNDLSLMKDVFDTSNFDGVKFKEVSSMENVKKKELLNSIKEKFKDNKDSDITYFYYSGHGNNLDQKSYICTVDEFGEQNNAESAKKEAEKAWISVNELREALDKVKGTKVVIFDSCNSGGFIGKDAIDAVSGATSSNHKKGISFDTIDKEGKIQSQKFNENITREFSNSENSTSTQNKYLVGEEYKVLTASSGNEYSFEDIKSGYGKFTKELHNGIQIKNNKIKADKNNDNKVSLEEMYSYLMTHVQYVSHIQAYPRKDNFTIYQTLLKYKDGEATEKDKDKNEENNSPKKDIFNISTTKTGVINDLGIQFAKEDGNIIGGRITSSKTTINTDLTVGEFLSHIIKGDENQEVYVQSKSSKPNKSLIKSNDKKLEKGDLLLIVSPNGNMITMKIEVKSAIDPLVPNFNGKYKVNNAFRTISSGNLKLDTTVTKDEFINNLILQKGFIVKYFTVDGREINGDDAIKDGDQIIIMPKDPIASIFPRKYRLIVDEFENDLNELD